MIPAKTQVLFSYKLDRMLQKDKVRFYYSLNGRNKKQGILNAYHLKKIGRSVLLADQEYVEKTRTFLSEWDCSVTTKKIISAGEPHVATRNDKLLLSYSIKHLPYNKKVLFYYALKGRDGKTGVINTYKIQQLGRGALLVPAQFAEQVTQFLEYWKCPSARQEIEVSA